MRDLILTMFIMGTIPFALMKPHIGLLMWAWVGYMNPHKLSWGFAYDFPFVLILAVVTVAAAVFSKEKKTLPIDGLVVVWLMFIIWMAISTYFAHYPDDAMVEFVRTLKIHTMILITILFFQSKERIIWLVWVVAFSLGFYGIKGGIFTVLTGGGHLVWGPTGTFVEGNNELALALIMITPLMAFLWQETKHRYLKYFLLACILMTVAAILGSYSRGALLAIGMMGFFFWLKSSKKIVLLIPILLVGLIASIFLPQEWFDRMDTIETFEEDRSAMGRINAWYFSFNYASDHPFFGGGYAIFDPEQFREYAPEPEDYHDAHSIYFEVLAEQGFVGLFLFLGIWGLTWLTGSSIIRKTRNIPSLKWSNNLVRMVQVGLIGYGTGGAFLGLAYFDLPYHLMAIMVVTNAVVDREIKSSEEKSKSMNRI